MKAWIAALALTSAACAMGGEAATPAANPAADEGREAYARHCLTCHQADGYGVPNMQPAITGGTWVQGDAQALVLFVMTGGFNSADRKEGESHNVMPAFRQLSDDELAALLSYVRRTFGKGAPPVSAAQVAAVRATLPAE